MSILVFNHHKYTESLLKCKISMTTGMNTHNTPWSNGPYVACKLVDLICYSAPYLTADTILSDILLDVVMSCSTMSHAVGPPKEINNSYTTYLYTSYVT